jgi:hypothetical protein
MNGEKIIISISGGGKSGEIRYMLFGMVYYVEKYSLTNYKRPSYEELCDRALKHLQEALTKAEIFLLPEATP